MFAVYALRADIDDPLSALRLGEQPEPDVREGWVRVKLSHATLNRHDLFTLRGSRRTGKGFRSRSSWAMTVRARSMMERRSSSIR
jgi:NADPH:quinone reductase-like Zn-dependent oxidoreductase